MDHNRKNALETGIVPVAECHPQQIQIEIGKGL
jgi:hypothetical protein